MIVKRRRVIIMANKRKKKKVTRRALSKPFATAVELARFRRDVARANRRIARLEAEKLEPPVLSFVKSALGSRIHIPRNLTEFDYKKISAIVERFLAVKESRLPAARAREKYRREQFRRKIVSAFGSEISSSAEDYLYYALGDINIKSLLSEYVYEEVVYAMGQLANARIRPTTDLVRSVLEQNIYYVVQDVLEQRGVDINSTLRDYVRIAIERGVDAAEQMYYSDVQNEV